jgi:flavodoxin
MTKVLILYDGTYGHVEQMAEAVAERTRRSISYRARMTRGKVATR